MVGTRLKKLRRESKLNQGELANIIGVNKSAVSHYETDKDDPSDKIKIEIAKHFNISLDYLLGLIDVPVPIYNEELYLKIPESINQSEKNILSDFLLYVEWKRRHI